MDADAPSDLLSEIARLRVSIDSAAAATDARLVPAFPVGDPAYPLAEHNELCRQLAALRERVALAEHRDEGPFVLRAELATLSFFAGTLQADADDWRSALGEKSREVEGKRAAARMEQEAVAAERETLVRRRDALQLTILHTAARMAQQCRGEWRRTVPVFTLGDGLTVCSVSVACPRRGFRFAKFWLVTLTGSHDVLVRRE